MSYTKTYTLDNTPSGDTVNNAIVNKLDKNADQIVADLNTHEALTTNAHGFTGTKTGSGAMVGATSPTLVTPTIGVATATSINKVAITAPATSATITVADGKTLTVSGDITIPTIATGGILYGSATGVLSALAKGTAYQVLQMNSGATAPEWTSTPSLGGISLTGTTTNSGTISGGTVNATTLQQGGVQAVTTSGSQTLTNKTITAPNISAANYTSGPGAYGFWAYYTADVDNISGTGSAYFFVGTGEKYNNDSCYSGGYYTVPEEGIYHLCAQWYLKNITTDHTYVTAGFARSKTVGWDYFDVTTLPVTAALSSFHIGASIDLWAGASSSTDVLVAYIKIEGTSETVDLDSGSVDALETFFSGRLVII